MATLLTDHVCWRMTHFVKCLHLFVDTYFLVYFRLRFSYSILGTAIKHAVLGTYHSYLDCLGLILLDVSEREEGVVAL